MTKSEYTARVYANLRDAENGLISWADAVQRERVIVVARAVLNRDRWGKYATRRFVERRGVQDMYYRVLRRAAAIKVQCMLGN